MAKLGGKKAWVAAGVALLLGLAIVPALSGAASVATVSPAVTSPSNQWAYGGEGWSNNTLTLGNTTITWDGMFGWTVIFTVSPGASSDVWTVEEQRTVGITITATVTSPNLTGTYKFHGQETDDAFANITNQSVVYVNGQAVPALGIDNASVAVNGLIDQSVTYTYKGVTRSASLDVNGAAQAATSFDPSLGLIPLNLTGVNEWNSSATGSPSASWNISWTYSGFNGTSGSGSKTGSLSATGPVTVTGYKVSVNHRFADNKTRVGILLVIQGPFNCYDGFILVPHDFDLFGSAPHGYDPYALGSAGISAETLYVTSGPGGLAVTAADQTFTAQDTAVNSGGASGLAPAASSASPSATVEGQPMSVQQAQAINHDLTTTPGASSGSSALSGVLLGAVIGLVVVAVAGTVGVIEWRSYARRRSKGGLVGGYGESWPNGVPPTSATPPGSLAPSRPGSTPEPVEDPNRRL